MLTVIGSGAEREAGVETSEQRTAGFGLLAFGALVVLFGLLSLVGGGSAALVGLTLAVGVVFVLLGQLIRAGSRQATVAALVLLGLVLVFELVSLVTNPGVQLVIWVLIIALLTYLTVRALRSA
jgi:hypothetical protein